MGVVKAIISAQRAEIDLDFDRAAAIDLAGRNVVEAVQTSVHPRVIDCPDPARSNKSTLSAIATTKRLPNDCGGLAGGDGL